MEQEEANPDWWKSSDWRKNKFINSLKKILDKSPESSNEQMIFDILYHTGEYLGLESLSTEHERDEEISILFGDIATLIKHNLLSAAPLKTNRRNADIALFIDFLVFFGADKMKAIADTASWLAMGVDSVEKIAKNNCRLKKIHGKIIGDAHLFTEGICLTAYPLQQFLNKQSRAFTSSEKTVLNAYSQILSIIEEHGIHDIPPLTDW